MQWITRFIHQLHVLKVNIYAFHFGQFFLLLLSTFRLLFFGVLTFSFSLSHLHILFYIPQCAHICTISLFSEFTVHPSCCLLFLFCHYLFSSITQIRRKMFSSLLSLWPFHFVLCLSGQWNSNHLTEHK